MPIDPTQPYDDANIFAKILRGEIPSNKVYEDEWAFAFHDIAEDPKQHVEKMNTDVGDDPAGFLRLALP